MTPRALRSQQRNQNLTKAGRKTLHGAQFTTNRNGKIIATTRRLTGTKRKDTVCYNQIQIIHYLLRITSYLFYSFY